jgi:hypothetical protein
VVQFGDRVGDPTGWLKPYEPDPFVGDMVTTVYRLGEVIAAERARVELWSIEIVKRRRRK